MSILEIAEEPQGREKSCRRSVGDLRPEDGLLKVEERYVCMCVPEEILDEVECRVDKSVEKNWGAGERKSRQQILVIVPPLPYHSLDDMLP